MSNESWGILRAKAKLKEDCDKRRIELTKALADSFALKLRNDYYRSVTKKLQPN